MKKHKRDVTQRAFNRGYLVGQEGKSKDLCPTSGTDKENWIAGWRAGISDNLDGMTGVAGIHRLPIPSAFPHQF